MHEALEKPAKSARPRGRPRAFDRDVALEQAMLVFWRLGYEAASLSELTAAMGINPPSLYAAFGDKERLFLEAVQRYVEVQGIPAERALQEAPTAREGIAAMLRISAEEWTKPCHPAGCMVVTAATNCSAGAEHVQAALAKRRAEATARMRERIERGIEAGELPPDTNAAALATFFSTVYQGMTVQARDGASPDDLLATAELAMRSWPVS
jgi:AcrR family transcriptional regulator